MNLKNLETMTEKQATKECFRQLTHPYNVNGAEVHMLRRAIQSLQNGGIEWTLVKGKLPNEVEIWRKNFTETVE